MALAAIMERLTRRSPVTVMVRQTLPGKVSDNLKEEVVGTSPLTPSRKIGRRPGTPCYKTYTDRHGDDGVARRRTHMRMASTLQRLMVMSLGLQLFSCSTIRSSSPDPTSVQELSRWVLVIKETPDGQVTHSWEPLSGFDLSKYPYRASSSIVEAPIVRAAWTRSCEDELDACKDMCVKSLRGRNWSHANRGSRDEICRDRCRPSYIVAVEP
jgi:hypothetical protein